MSELADRLSAAKHVVIDDRRILSSEEVAEIVAALRDHAPQVCRCGPMCEDKHRPGCRYFDVTPTRVALRALVDAVWQHATDSTAVPSTDTADRLITKTIIPSHDGPQSAATSAALTDTREALSADLEKVQCELDAAVLRVNDLETALKFYRDAWQYKPGPTGLGLEWSPKEELLDDCGNRAKDALARNERGSPAT